VVITRPFAVGKYEVTRGEFGQFMDDTKYDIPCWKYAWQQKIPSDHPAVCVSWNDAKAYAKWLADKTGKAYRLLTEAEWEYAARAGTTTKYWWGDEVKEGGQVWANCDGCGSTWDSKSAPVGSFAPNAFGLYDTAGNVNEWVEDCYHDGYTGAPTDGSAWVSGDCRSRVIRGGAWGWDPDHGLSASRHGDASSDSGANLGFRLARTLP
jgi:formylglycine-generating enzyme required for sulfatase activity